MKHPIIFLELSLLLTSAVVAGIIYALGIFFFPAAAMLDVAMSIGGAAGLVAFVAGYHSILHNS